MVRVDNANGVWSLWVNGALFAESRPDAPFAVAIRREKVYTSNRGTVKVQTVERERHALGEVTRLENGVVFSGGSHTLQIEISERPGGAELTFHGEDGWAYEFNLSAVPGEAVFGGGEQYRQTDLRGEKVVNFVSEHIKASTIVEKALLPRFLYREKPHSRIGSYAPMPVFVTDSGRLFLFDTTADGYSVFGEDRYLFSFDRCPDKLILFTAESYRELSRLLNGVIPNRQYIPDWCHDGMILAIQGGTKTVLAKTLAMLDAGARVCGVWSQDWSGENITAMGKQVWWNWEKDEKLYPDLKAAIEKLNERGVRFLAYINPYLVKGGKLYNECREKGFLITHADGSIYHIKSTTFDAGMLDLTNPAAVDYIKNVLIKKNMLDIGISGWMADFGEYLPVDCVLHDGDPARLHNLWPVLWAKINREAIEEYGREDVFFFTRSGYLGIQKYAPVMWNGDQHTDTTRDYGMPCVMPASFSLGFSGVTAVHCDIGGFFSFGKLKRSEELFTRWMEMCCFSLLMRSHEAIRPWANAQFDAPGVLPHTVRLTNIHAALKPYIEKCTADAGEGIPALRPDFWEEMSRRAGRDEYSYFLGDELFVCPVIREHKKERAVYLPAGEWIHFWSGKEYSGPCGCTVPAPLGEIPVFYRKNGAYAELFRRTAEQYR